MNRGMNGKSRAKKPTIGRAKTIKNWARIGSALMSSNIGIITA